MTQKIWTWSGSSVRPVGLLDKPAKGRYTAGPLARVAVLVPLSALTIAPDCLLRAATDEPYWIGKIGERGFLTPRKPSLRMPRWSRFSMRHCNAFPGTELVLTPIERHDISYQKRSQVAARRRHLKELHAFRFPHVAWHPRLNTDPRPCLASRSRVRSTTGALEERQQGMLQNCASDRSVKKITNLFLADAHDTPGAQRSVMDTPENTAWNSRCFGAITPEPHWTANPVEIN